MKQRIPAYTRPFGTGNTSTLNQSPLQPICLLYGLLSVDNLETSRQAEGPRIDSQVYS